MVLIISIATIIYLLLIVYIYTGWEKTSFSTKVKNPPCTRISVIVAARNESNHIINCLQCILDNIYPADLYEIIVVDDHSTDDTLSKAKSVRFDHIKVVSLPDGFTGKKYAISYGVSKASFPVILTTDADCSVGKYWLKTYNEIYASGAAEMTTGVVLPELEDSLLGRFQWLDLAATMAITANGITRKHYFLANGANLSYLKSSFFSVSGFDGNQHLASGDDIFLINKVAQTGTYQVTFVKSTDAAVTTKAETSWSALLRQRKRWATKSMYVKDKWLLRIQAFVFSYVLLLGVALMAGILLHWVWMCAAIISLGIKAITDFLFLRRMAVFYNQQGALKYFILSFFLYFWHILMSGWFALFPTEFEWKGRRLK